MRSPPNKRNPIRGWHMYRARATPPEAQACFGHRQRRVQHLHRCGPRCILEALLAVENGEPLDAVLADFERLPPETYHAAFMLFLDGGVA